MDRRKFFRGVAGVGALGAASLFSATAVASPSKVSVERVPEPSADGDPFAFITDDLSEEQAADLIFEDAPKSERDAYLAAVRDMFPNSSPRDQLEQYLRSAESSENASPAGMEAPASGAVAPAVIPIAVRIAAQAIIAAAKRYGPAVYNSLKSAVSKGYSAFVEWTKSHPWVAGIIGGLATNAIYDALKALLGL